VQIDWSTIVLEIVNFLVLVWILKRFLYQPVLDIIERRKAGIDATAKKAEASGREADALKQLYEGRLADWERERAAARDALRQELDAERRRRVEALQADMQAEREKVRVTDERRAAETRRRSEQQAVAQSARFAAKLLGRLSGPDLDARLTALLVDELAQLPPEKISMLRRQGTPDLKDAEVLSAQRLEPDIRLRVESTLHTLFDRPLACRFREEPALIAGVRITLGPWVLRANLQDELQGFAELSDESTAD
jgi:F-type H+-transporting ATPase subunit b